MRIYVFVALVKFIRNHAKKNQEIQFGSLSYHTSIRYYEVSDFCLVKGKRVSLRNGNFSYMKVLPGLGLNWLFE